jgi:hypothetical protein
MSPRNTSPRSDAVVEYCFQDRDVIELARRQWGASGLVLISDEYGNTIPLLEMPRRVGRFLVSPYEAGIALSDKLPAELRSNRLLAPLVDRVLSEVGGERDLSVKIMIPFEFLESHGHGVLEPFLLARFMPVLEFWDRSVDLRLSQGEIVRRVAERVRRRLRQGLTEAPELRLYYQEAVPGAVLKEFFNAATRTREAGGTRIRHHSELYTVDRANLIRDGKAALAVCRHDAHTSYLLALVSSRLGYYWDGAWAAEKSAFANHYLHYRMMLFLKELGVRRYSLGYVFPGLLAPPGKEQSIAFFKEGFGDELRPVYTLTLTRESRKLRVARKLLAGPAGWVLRRLGELAGPR